MRQALAPLLSLVVLAPFVSSCSAGKASAAPNSPMSMGYPPPPPAAAAEAPGYAQPAAPMTESAKADKAEEKKPEGKDAGGDKPVSTWKRAGEQVNQARIKVGDRETLPLDGVEAKVEIHGFRARVVLDYHFRNDKSFLLEGSFQMRLPEGGSAHFFAFGAEAQGAAQTIAAAQVPIVPAAATRAPASSPLEIMRAREGLWATPKEAKVVPREQALFAYTQTVRQRVDPALMEWAGTGVFNARVFPLVAGKRHRVVVGYDVDLVRAGNELEYRLELPPEAKDATVDIEVTDTPASLVKADGGLAQGASGAGVRLRGEHVAGRAFTVRVRDGGPVALSGEDGATGAYFASSVLPQLPAAKASGGSESAVFLLDTSLSASPDRFNVQKKLLLSILDKNRASLKRFSVLLFNIEQSWYKEAWVENTPQQAEELSRYIDTLSLDGATDLSAALSEGARPSWAGAGGHDIFLLSDGASTWGEGDVATVSQRMGKGHKGALFAYQLGLAGGDVQMLSALARETGGAVFSVPGEAEIDRAAIAHKSRPARLLSAKVEGASDVLLAGRPGVLYPGQRLLVTGRGKPGGELALEIEHDGQRSTVKVPLGKVMPSHLAPRVYGEVSTGQLEELSGLNEMATRYATHFRVPGKTCSLLMLEGEADYRRFNLTQLEAEATSAVKSTQVGPAIARELSLLGEAAADPKRGFLTWLDRLSRSKVVQIAPPSWLAPALERAPSQSFEVKAPRLVTKARTHTQIGERYEKALATRSFDYDQVVAEAERRRNVFGKDDGLRALSSLVEQSPGDAVLARDVGSTALAWGMPAHAVHLFRRVVADRPHEPQTYRALAQAFADAGKADLAIATYEVALAGKWDGRFGDFKEIVALEYSRLLRRIDKGELSTTLKAEIKGRAAQLPMAGKTFDLLVAIDWNTDNTDVDLHVTEPSGEDCFYGNRSTRSGGQLTRDVTQGYGPEMYVLPQAPTGPYRVWVHYYASDRNRLSARSKVHATVYRRWGSSDEQVSEKVMLLEQGKSDATLDIVQVGGRAPLEIVK